MISFALRKSAHILEFHIKFHCCCHSDSSQPSVSTYSRVSIFSFSHAVQQCCLFLTLLPEKHLKAVILPHWSNVIEKLKNWNPDKKLVSFLTTTQETRQRGVRLWQSENSSMYFKVFLFVCFWNKYSSLCSIADKKTKC